MAQTTLRTNNRRLDFIKNWCEDQQVALTDLKNKIVNGLADAIHVDEKFYYMSAGEVLEYFEESFIELEHLVSFNLLSAVEAMLRSSFLEKVKNKDKSETGRKFRAVYKDKGEKISLEDDILEILKETLPATKSAISSLKGALKYRHWIDHGRYWNPKLGRVYNVEIVFKIASDALRAVKI